MSHLINILQEYQININKKLKINIYLDLINKINIKIHKMIFNLKLIVELKIFKVKSCQKESKRYQLKIKISDQ